MVRVYRKSGAERMKKCSSPREDVTKVLQGMSWYKEVSETSSSQSDFQGYRFTNLWCNSQKKEKLEENKGKTLFYCTFTYIPSLFLICVKKILHCQFLLVSYLKRVILHKE